MLKIIIDTQMGDKPTNAGTRKPEGTKKKPHGLMGERESKDEVISLIEQAQEKLKTDSQQSTTDASMYLDMALSSLTNKPKKED